MKTIFVKYYDPLEVMDESIDSLSKQEVLENCFRVVVYPNAREALEAYANTHCTWSTLLEESANFVEFTDKAYNAIINRDYDWLKNNFT